MFYIYKIDTLRKDHCFVMANRETYDETLKLIRKLKGDDANDFIYGWVKELHQLPDPWSFTDCGDYVRITMEMTEKLLLEA